jgi:hypothetical protein
MYEMYVQAVVGSLSTLTSAQNLSISPELEDVLRLEAEYSLLMRFICNVLDVTAAGNNNNNTRITINMQYYNNKYSII